MEPEEVLEGLHCRQLDFQGVVSMRSPFKNHHRYLGMPEAGASELAVGFAQDLRLKYQMAPLDQLLQCWWFSWAVVVVGQES